MILQSTASPVAVLGTLVLFAGFLSLTVHLAARNVLGTVDPKRALYVGPLPATIGVVGSALEVSPGVTVPIAVLVDAVVIRWAYAQPSRKAALITLVHFVVTVLLGTIVVGIAILLATRPG